MERFFDCLPTLLNEDTKEIGKTLVNSGIPCVFSLSHRVKKLEEVLLKIKPELEFHKRNIMKTIADY